MMLFNSPTGIRLCNPSSSLVSLTDACREAAGETRTGQPAHHLHSHPQIMQTIATGKIYLKKDAN